MEMLSEKIKSISQIEFPPGLHGRIMKKLLFLQFRTPFFIVLSLLLLNMAITGWRLWVRAADSQFGDIFSAYLSTFEFSREYFSSFFQTTNEFIPISAIISFVVNLLLLGYLFYLTRAFRKFGRNRSAGTSAH